MSYKVVTNIFEGPFDLLVYLIESARMSIYDIEVSSITSQYLEYIEEMQHLDVAVSSEFIVLAAELIQLKSKMLLPKTASDEEILSDEDPRRGLAEKLAEYKRFKNISGMLADREEKGLLVYEKPQEDISRFTEEPDEYLSLDMKQFVSAFHSFLQKKQKEEEIRERYERIERQKRSAETKTDFIKSLFEEDRKKTVRFRDLVENPADKYDIALSFSSMLEMVRQGTLEADQKFIFGEILVTSGKERHGG